MKAEANLSLKKIYIGTAVLTRLHLVSEIVEGLPKYRVLQGDVEQSNSHLAQDEEIRQEVPAPQGQMQNRFSDFPDFETLQQH